MTDILFLMIMTGGCGFFLGCWFEMNNNFQDNRKSDRKKIRRMLKW